MSTLKDKVSVTVAKKKVFKKAPVQVEQSPVEVEPVDDEEGFEDLAGEEVFEELATPEPAPLTMESFPSWLRSTPQGMKIAAYVFLYDFFVMDEWEDGVLPSQLHLSQYFDKSQLVNGNISKALHELRWLCGDLAEPEQSLMFPVAEEEGDVAQEPVVRVVVWLQLGTLCCIPVIVTIAEAETAIGNLGAVSADTYITAIHNATTGEELFYEILTDLAPAK